LEAGVALGGGEDGLAEGEELADGFAELVGEAREVAACFFHVGEEAGGGEGEGVIGRESLGEQVLVGGFLEEVGGEGGDGRGGLGAGEGGERRGGAHGRGGELRA